MAPGASASPLTFSRSAVFKKAGSWSWDTLTSPAYMNSNIAWRWLYATSLRIIIGCLDGFSCIQRDWFIHFIKFHYWFKRKGFWHFLVGRKYIERDYREKVQKNHFSLFFFKLSQTLWRQCQFFGMSMKEIMNVLPLTRIWSTDYTPIRPSCELCRSVRRRRVLRP